jgi:predicted nucleotidyltransferase
MDQRTNKIINDFIYAVSEQYSKLVTAYIFGSYAKDSDRPDSDIDIALIIDNLKDEEKFDVQVQLILLAAKFNLRIEPHPIPKDDFNSGNPFAFEIKRTGIEIKPRTHNTFQ